MEWVDPAHAAEIVPRDACVPLIEREFVFAADEREITLMRLSSAHFSCCRASNRTYRDR